MTESTKSVAKRLSAEEKAGINKMLAEKIPHKDIIKKYNISAGTVSNMVKKLAAKTSKSTDHKDSKHVTGLKESLIAIRNRKILVEEMLTGSLKQELDQLTTAEENLERTIDSIVQLEAYTQHK